MEKIIEVKKVDKTIKNKKILNNINFDVYSGECLAIIGPNGAGKTTLMNLLLGNKFLSSGSIKINKLDPTNKELKEYVNILSQENSIPDTLKVKELITFYKSIYKDSLTEKEIDKLLQFTDEQKTSWLLNYQEGNVVYYLLF